MSQKSELERTPLSSSPIQQIKDIAGVPDMPNPEFIAWFSRLIGIFKNLRIVTEAQSYGEYADSLAQTPATIPANENGPRPAA